VGHPEERERRVVDQAELAPEVEPEVTEDPRGRLPRVGREEQGLAGCGPERSELLLREELRDRGAQLAVCVTDDVRESLRSSLLRELLQCGKLGARVRARDAEEPHGLGACEDAELRAARRLGRVLEFQPEAGVRLVRPEAAVGLRIRYPRPWSF